MGRYVVSAVVGSVVWMRFGAQSQATKGRLDAAGSFMWWYVWSGIGRVNGGVGA